MENIRVKNTFIKMLSLLLAFVFMFSALNVPALATTGDGTGTQEEEKEEIVDTNETPEVPEEPEVPEVPERRSAPQEIAITYQFSTTGATAAAAGGYMTLPANELLPLDATTNSATFSPDKPVAGAKLVNTTDPDAVTLFSKATADAKIADLEGTQGVKPLLDLSGNTLYYSTGDTGQYIYEFVGYRVITNVHYDAASDSTKALVDKNQVGSVYSDYATINKIMNTKSGETISGLTGAFIPVGGSMTFDDTVTSAKIYPLFVSVVPYVTKDQSKENPIPDEHFTDTIQQNDLYTRFYIMNVELGNSPPFNPFDVNDVAKVGNDEKKFADLNQFQGALISPDAKIYTHAAPVLASNPVTGAEVKDIQEADVIDEVLMFPETDRPTDEEALNAFNDERGTSFNATTHGVFWYVAKVEGDGYHIDGIIYSKEDLDNTVTVNFYDVDNTLMFTQTVWVTGTADAAQKFHGDSHVDLPTQFDSDEDYNNVYPLKEYNDAENPDKVTFIRTYDWEKNFVNEEGYEFGGWYSTSQSQGGGVEIESTSLGGMNPASSGLFVEDPATGNYTLNLYARVGVDLQYNSNVNRYDGSTNQVFDDTNNAHAMGADVTVSTFKDITDASTLFKAPANHKFVSWNTQADGNGVSYDPSDVANNTITMPTLPNGTSGDRNTWTQAPVVLYAQYERTYTVTYDENLDLDDDAATGVSAENEVVADPLSPYSVGATVNVLPKSNTLFDTFKKENYDFVGWELRYTLNGTEYFETYDVNGILIKQNNTDVQNGTTEFKMPAADVVLHAIYTQKAFTFTVDDEIYIYNGEYYSTNNYTVTDVLTGNAITSTVSYTVDSVLKNGSSIMGGMKNWHYADVGVYEYTITASAVGYPNTVTATATLTILPRPISVDIANFEKEYDKGANTDVFGLAQTVSGTDSYTTVEDETGKYLVGQYASVPANVLKDDITGAVIADISAYLNSRSVFFTNTDMISRSNDSVHDVSRAQDGTVQPYVGVLQADDQIADPTNGIAATRSNYIVVDVAAGNYQINPIPVTRTANDVEVAFYTSETDTAYTGKLGHNYGAGSRNILAADESILTFGMTEDANVPTNLAIAPTVPAGATSAIAEYPDMFVPTVTGDATILGNYDWTMVNGLLRVTEGTFGVIATPYDGIYDGIEHAVSVSVDPATPITGTATIEFHLDDDNDVTTVPPSTSTGWSTDVPAETNYTNGVQTYHYRVNVSGYGERTGTVTINVSQRQISALAIENAKDYGQTDPAFALTSYQPYNAAQANVVDDVTLATQNDSMEDITAWENDLAALDIQVRREVASGTTADASNNQAGEYTNVLVPYIAGTNPNNNYILVPNAANFTINPLQIIFTPGDYEKVYGDTDDLSNLTTVGFTATGSGATNTYFDYNVSGDALAAGDSYGTVEVERATGVEIAGTYPVEMVVTYTGQSQYFTVDDITTTAIEGNYQVTMNTAEFVITRRPYTITVLDYEKFYSQNDQDSTLTAANPNEIEGSQNTHFGYTVSGLLPNHITSANVIRTNNDEDVLLDPTTGLADAYDVVLDIENGTAQVYDAAHNTVTLNYADPTIVLGDFTIKPLVIELAVEDFFKTYGYADSESQLITANPNAIAATNGTWSYEITSGAPADNALLNIKDILEVSVIRTNAPGQPGVVEPYTNANIAGSATPIYTGVLVPTVTITSASNANVTSNYTIQAVNGNFRVDPRPVTITANGFSKVNTAADPSPLTSYISAGTLREPGHLGAIGAQRIGTFIGNPIGTHIGVIAPTYTANPNYVVTLINGDVTITEVVTPPVPPVPPVPPTPPTPPEPPTPPTPPTPPETPEPPETPPILDIPETDPPATSTIEETELPLAPGAAWALLNLILTIATCFMSIVLLVNYFARKKGEEESEKDKQMEKAETEEEKEEVKHRGVMRLMSIIPAVVAVIVFILTEDMTLPMTIVDDWTWLMAAIAIAQVVVATFSKKHIEYNDEDQDFDSETFA